MPRSRASRAQLRARSIESRWKPSARFGPSPAPSTRSSVMANGEGNGRVTAAEVGRRLDDFRRSTDKTLDRLEGKLDDALEFEPRIRDLERDVKSIFETAAGRAANRTFLSRF